MDKTFDIDGTGVANGNFFGFPYSEAEAEMVVYPVPWDVTASYGEGTADAPQRILEASTQLDFFDFSRDQTPELKIGTRKPDEGIAHLNNTYRPVAREVMDFLESGGNALRKHREIDSVNKACREMVNKVYADTRALLSAGKKVVLVGGDHSTPLGYIGALADRFDEFGVLHIDAHADLRDSYQGFDYSHASIMSNVLKYPQVIRLSQVAVRDASLGEMKKVRTDGRICLFDDYAVQKELFNGTPWAQICEQIVGSLPERVYISFDVDGLQPALCPNTGTPVPGGLEWMQAMYLISAVKESGHEVIGADVCEAGSSDWDANVGARILYKLCTVL